MIGAVDPYSAAFGAAANVASSAIESTMGGAATATTGAVHQGGNITFGSKLPAWVLPAVAVVAAVWFLKRKR